MPIFVEGCPVCRKEHNKLLLDYKLKGLYFRCEKCGKFILDLQVYKQIGNWPQNSKFRKKLSEFIKAQHSQDDCPFITTDIIASVEKS